MVFPNVLEHLYDADKLLRQSRDLLNAGGKVLVSLPNVAYFENRFGLFKGNWNYTDGNTRSHSYPVLYPGNSKKIFNRRRFCNSRNGT